MKQVPRKRRLSLVNPVRVCVVLDQPLWERAQRLAELYGISVSHQARAGIRMFHEALAGAMEDTDESDETRLALPV